MHDTASKVRDTAIRAYRRTRALARQYERRIRQRWRTATPQQRQTARVTAGSAALGLAVAFTAVAATGPWDSGQRTAERSWAAAQHPGSGGNHTGDGTDGDGTAGAPQVLAALNSDADPGSGPEADPDSKPSHGPGAAGVPPPSASALADTLEPLLKDGALGPLRTASVVDAASGRRLYAAKPRTPASPASTVKLATATAALSARGTEHRIVTRAVRGDAADEVVLVGGGDPTLSASGLSGLAAKTARTLRAQHTGKVSLGYDTSLYSGPVRHTIGPNDNLAPVTPLMVDEGRSGGAPSSAGEPVHGPGPRVTDPASDAASDFAAALEKHGVDVQDKPKQTRAPGKAKELAAHRSAPLSALVERMLTYSDNDIAEALARQTALASHRAASFKGAGKAVRHRLGTLGLPLAGAHFADGSGLDRADKVTPALLTRLLVRAADPDHAELRPVLTGLPVAHFTGTLGARYGGEEGAQGAGLVRAKTGTLTGVNTLAGTVVDADGRLLVFAFMTTGTTDGNAAQHSLDRLAAALANCGCRDSPSSD